MTMNSTFRRASVAALSRGAGILGAVGFFYLVGFTVGNSSPGLAFLTMLIGCPLLYFLPLSMTKHFNQSSPEQER
jgi:uncharacterized ion transporter superfamily protein YfcC